MSDKLRLIAVSVVVPVLLMLFAYYGFSTNYTRWVFGEQSFRGQYERGIYRYRVVGREGVLATHRFVTSRFAPPNEKPIAFTQERMPWLDGAGDLAFYNAYFVWNTLGLVLAMLVLGLMLRDPKLFALSDPELSLWVLVSAALLALTQFVVTPYDTWAAALLLGGAWASLRALVSPSVPMVAVAVALLVVGALNRETALLNVALVGAFAWSWFGLTRRSIAASVIAGVAFAATYLSLRFVYGASGGAFDSFAFGGSVRDTFSRIGTLTLLCTLGVPFLVPGASLKLYGRFLLFALPYVVMTLGAGVTWEVRLWIPLFLCGLLCARARHLS